MKVGFIGFRHGHVFSLYDMVKNNSNYDIVAACEENEEARKAAEEQHGIVFTHDKYEDLLMQNDADIIVVGDYYSRRGKIIEAALRAGKHVMADKPLCTREEELQRIKALAKEKKLKVGCMLTMRYEKNVTAAAKLVKEGKLGKIHNIYFGGQHPLCYGNRPMWYFEGDRYYGGVINDIAIHGIDMAYFICNARVKNILAARCWNAYAHEAKGFKDSGQFMLEMDNGAGLIADVSYSVPDSFGYLFPYYWEYQISGENGMIRFSVNSDGVEVYLNGKTEKETIYGDETKEDCFTDFYKEINGVSGTRLSTDEVLLATADTLRIQKYADGK